MKQIVDRTKGMKIKELEILTEDEREADGQRWEGKEMLRKELNGLFRQG